MYHYRNQSAQFWPLAWLVKVHKKLLCKLQDSFIQITAAWPVLMFFNLVSLFFVLRHRLCRRSPSFLPWVPEVFLACGGNFPCWPKAEATSGEAARKTSGTERCFLPSPLTFELFLSDYIYANQIESLRQWSCGPAPEEMSKDPHYP